MDIGRKTSSLVWKEVGTDVLTNISNTSVDLGAEKFSDMTNVVSVNISAEKTGLGELGT